MLKHFAKAAALVCALAVIGGCSPKPLSPEEAAAERERQIKMVERVYPDKSPEEVIKAADRVIRLADDDYNLAHNPNGFTAYRRWAVYMVITAALGEDTWIINVQPHGTGSKITALHSAASGAANAFVSANGTVTPYTSPMGSGMITPQPAVYQLFYSRLENLLYGKGQWITCKEAGKLFTDGSLGALCVCANDRTPDGMSAVQRKARENTDKDNDMGGIHSAR
jgi:hypothetical protein